MLALHSPVEGIVPFTVQEPDRLTSLDIFEYYLQSFKGVQQKTQVLSLVINLSEGFLRTYYSTTKDVQTVKTPGGLSMFFTCIDVLIQTSIISRKDLITQ